MEEWMLRLMAEMAKLNALIKEKILSNFVSTWKSLMDFFAWNWTCWNFNLGIWWLDLFMIIALLCVMTYSNSKDHCMLCLYLFRRKSKIILFCNSFFSPFLFSSPVFLFFFHGPMFPSIFFLCYFVFYGGWKYNKVVSKNNTRYFYFYKMKSRGIEWF